MSAESVDHLLADPGSGRERSMSMGWASGQQPGVTYGMQGSNTMWAATSVMDRDARLTALVVGNDGRTRVLTASAHLATQLLDQHRP